MPSHGCYSSWSASRLSFIMDLTHIHLLLNHFPTVGNLIGGGLFVLALITKSNDLKRASLAILLGISLIAIPTYMSGNGAQEAIKAIPGVSKAQIEGHEGAAMIAMIFMEATGAFAWLALWQFRRLSRIPNWNLTVILILTAATFGLMAPAANMGGDIRYDEIRAVADTDPPAPSLACFNGSFVTETPWMWP